MKRQPALALLLLAALAIPARAQRISDLPTATSAAGTDQLPANQSGTTRKVTVTQILAALGVYVGGATTNQGLLLTGTLGATLGLKDCAANEVLKRNAGDTAWDCAADATGATSNAFGTIDLPAGTDPVADAAPDTLAVTCGGGLTCTGTASTDTWDLTVTSVLSHAASHKNGGPDEVATSSPAANAIPKAGAGALLGTGWLGSGTPTSSNWLRGDGAWAALPADDDQPDSDAEVPDAITVSGGAVTNSDITWKQSTTPVPTAEGRVEWDTDDDRLAVGTGAATVNVYPGQHGKAGACAGNQFETADNGEAAPTCAQPAFTNLSGSLALGQLPAHASAHQNGGADEIATVTAGANAIPKAGAGGTLAAGWIPALPYVTSVALTVPSWLAITGSPVTSSGTLAVTAAAAQTADRVLGTCAGGTSVSLCALTVSQLPIVTAAKGGTGVDTSASTGVLRVAVGTWTANAGLSHLAASTSADLAGVLSDETGTGAVALAVSPALTGAPTAPTAAADTNTTQISSTAFVQQEINGAGGRSLTCASGSCDADPEIYEQTKSITIESPAAADDFLWFRAERSLTVTGIDCIVVGGTSVSVLVKECDANAGSCTNTEAAITCGTTNTTEASGIDDAAIAAGAYVRLDPGTVTGSVTQLFVQIVFQVAD